MVQGMRRRACLLAVAVVIGLTHGTVATPSPVAADSGEAWQWPLSPTPQVVNGFDPPATPYGPGHVGVDLLGWPGQPVTAVADGTVHFAGQVAGTQVVSVMHGVERSTYQPVVAAVTRGDVVVAGQPLGTLTSLGGHCLPLTCLHLGRRAGDTYLDPLALLGGGPVRLLPRAGAPVSAPSPPMRQGTITADDTWGAALRQGSILGLLGSMLQA